MEHETLSQIILRRQEIEQELTGLLEQNCSDFGLDDIRQCYLQRGRTE